MMEGALTALALRCDLTLSERGRNKEAPNNADGGTDGDRIAVPSSSSLLLSLPKHDIEAAHSRNKVRWEAGELDGGARGKGREASKGSSGSTKTRLFECTVVAYALSLCAAILASQLSGHAQPALIYLGK